MNSQLTQFIEYGVVIVLIMPVIMAAILLFRRKKGDLKFSNRELNIFIGISITIMSVSYFMLEAGFMGNKVDIELIFLIALFGIIYAVLNINEKDNDNNIGS